MSQPLYFLMAEDQNLFDFLERNLRNQSKLDRIERKHIYKKEH